MTTRYNAITESTLTREERAALIVRHVEKTGMLIGMRGCVVGEFPTTVSQLADCGIPENHDLPFDSAELRALVFEYSCLQSETYFNVSEKLPTWALELE